ncbi:hypothetical protein [Tateyamaria sp. Alg231-49]|uniref:hypothetical protein n=1 Tax=Tateyamaria sp. Alg231-49 TaxID=1922219 RepID=UPI000D54C2D6|nr:hypothetical protein [Tateyamaria sp. Alg231-49]
MPIPLFFRAAACCLTSIILCNHAVADGWELLETGVTEAQSGATMNLFFQFDNEAGRFWVRTEFVDGNDLVENGAVLVTYFDIDCEKRIFFWEDGGRDEFTDYPPGNKIRTRVEEFCD